MLACNSFELLRKRKVKNIHFIYNEKNTYDH